MVFCRIMNQVLEGLAGHSIHVYLDDIIIQGRDLMDNVDNLEKVFLRLQESNLKVNLKKCTFFKSVSISRIHYLSRGIKTSTK